MCGRYYIDQDTANEIEKLVRNMDPWNSHPWFQGDVHPTDAAPVLVGSGNQVRLEWLRWGFPGGQNKNLIINSRSETVLEKRMFSESVLHRRAVIPCTWFYEWNRNKEKVTFRRNDKNVIFMAGIYNLFGDEKCFSILTTEANQLMSAVHDRMPLIIERDDIRSWILNDSRVHEFLKWRDVSLCKQQEYEQEVLRFL